MQTPYTKYIEQMMFFDRKVPEVLFKIKDIAAKRFGLANVSLECDFSAFDRIYHNSSIENDLQQALSARTSSLPDFRARPIKKRPRTYFKTLTPQFWSKFSLLIYIPERVVTNEENAKTKIKNLFVRVPLTPEGKLAGKFMYLKTWFTYEQYEAGYIHSHCTRFDRSDIRAWHTVCTGSGKDTPINTSIQKLKTEDFNHIVWECFFWELEKATGSESLTGGPYVRISYISNGTEKVKILNSLPSANRDGLLRNKKVKELLTKYVEEGNFRVVYNNGHFTIPESFVSWLEKFTEFYTTNRQNTTPLALTQYDVFNDCLYTKTSRERRNTYQENGTQMIRFKGTPYYLIIADEKAQDVNTKTLVSAELGYVILSYLLSIVNTKLADTLYEKNTAERKEYQEARESFFYAHHPKTDTEGIKYI